MSDASDLDSIAIGAAAGSLDGITAKTGNLSAAAANFSRVMTQAFSSSVTSGQKFDDVLKSLALKLSDVTTRAALQPQAGNPASGIAALAASLFGGGSSAAGATVRPFAAGGVIGAPTYFPLSGGGTGLAGEAGPEAIMPLQRAADGSLGVAGGGGGNTINVQIATPDLDAFRRSEGYLSGQIARAVSRGQRSL